MSAETLKAVIDRHINRFLDIPPEERADIGVETMAGYHAMLGRLFHQVVASANTLAIAGGNLGPDRIVARDYLMGQANIEKSQWQRILDDLTATGYDGPELSQQFPGVETAAFLAFTYYVAQRMPLARLGIAAMLDSLSARLGKAYALKVLAALRLTPSEMSFLLGHGETDATRATNILDVLQRSHLSEAEWKDVVWAAEVAATLYENIYAAH